MSLSTAEAFKKFENVMVEDFIAQIVAEVSIAH